MSDRKIGSTTCAQVGLERKTQRMERCRWAALAVCCLPRTHRCRRGMLPALYLTQAQDTSIGFADRWNSRPEDPPSAGPQRAPHAAGKGTSPARRDAGLRANPGEGGGGGGLARGNDR